MTILPAGCHARRGTEEQHPWTEEQHRMFRTAARIRVPGGASTLVVRFVCAYAARRAVSQQKGVRVRIQQFPCHRRLWR